MTKAFFIIFFLACFTSIYLLIGIIAARRVKNVTDYLFAGRNLNVWQATFGLIATQLGGGMLLGTSQKAFEIGFWGILYTLGMSLGFLLLGLGIAARLQSLRIDTVAQLFQDVYKSSFLRFVASLLSIVTLCGILIAQIVASKTLLYTLTGPQEAFFILFWLFIIAYTIIGGLHAVALIDSLQVIFIICIFGGIFLYSYLTQPYNFSSLIALGTTKHASSFSFYVPIFVVPALFSIIEQDLAQKFFAARSKMVAMTSSFIASIFMLLFACIPIYFGMYARTLLQGSTEGSPLLISLEHITNPLFYALAVCAIIAAITSTADSLLCAISSNISQDFSFGRAATNTLRRSKVITWITGLSALGASYMMRSDIIDILIQSYEVSVACLFVPLIAALYKKRVTTASAYGSCLAGLTSYVLFHFYPVAYSGIYIIAISALGFYVGLHISNKRQVHQ